MDFHLPKKKIFSAVLCGALMLSASVPAFAFSDSSIASSVFEENQMAVEQAAAAGNGADLSQSPYVLKRLGLVAGNDKGDLMLDKVGTRAEALTLFISMQGEQDEARAVDYSVSVYGYSGLVPLVCRLRRIPQLYQRHQCDKVWFL